MVDLIVPSGAKNTGSNLALTGNVWNEVSSITGEITVSQPTTSLTSSIV